MRTRKYRIRPAPRTENEWLVEYSYLGLFWKSIEAIFVYDYFVFGPMPITYNSKAEAKAVIDEDIRLRKAIAEHQTKGSERYP